jgi:hypothetical protein
MTYRRYEIINTHETIETTNSLPHALKLLAKHAYSAVLADSQPDPKYRWLKQDITAAKH